MSPFAAPLISAVLITPFVAHADAVLTGPDGLFVTLTADALAALPAHEVDTAYMSSRGEVRAHYTGARLWDVIAAHTDIADDVKPALRQVVIVTARDDHQIAFSIGELSPDFGNALILIGYALDGAAIPDGPHMVAPGDARGARHVKEVVRLEIR